MRTLILRIGCSFFFIEKAFYIQAQVDLADLSLNAAIDSPSWEAGNQSLVYIHTVCT